MRSRSRQLPDVEALELVAAGDQVVMSVRAAGIGVPVRDEDARAVRRRSSSPCATA